jgi:hypothetical protein
VRAVLAVIIDDYLWFVDQALDSMVGIVGQLGDVDANRRPAVEGANSPYAILTHCLGVVEYWGGHVVAGRPVQRDRDAEFEAQGTVAELAARAGRARRQLEADLSVLGSSAAPRGAVAPADADLPFGRSQGGVLLHILEELTQHLGQMELTRDVLVANWNRDSED